MYLSSLWCPATPPCDKDFTQAVSLNDQQHESLYNSALLHWQLGEVQDAAKMCHRSLDVYPDHWESLELKKEIKKKLMTS